MEDYLEKLSLTDEEKLKIKRLATDSPAALFSMIEAEPEVFDKYLGEKTARKLKTDLEMLLKPSERKILQESRNIHPQLGAIVGERSPVLPKTSYNIEERDRLFDELRYWESQNTDSRAVKSKIAQLNKQLNELLAK
ncbi:MAG TPA: hypothetical protein PKE69_27910 [Pyrinomonadaceae bacterium]|nr:hypothetical protein [Pyrinomonadaceae bacterium]